MKTSFDGFANRYSRNLLIALVFVISFSTATLSQELWGLLSQGGTNNFGTIGHYDVSTSSWIVDYNFAVENSVSGRNPTTELTKCNGKFYGMSSGGANNLGELFEWDPLTNSYSTKVDFSAALGSNPQGSLTSSEGKLYGMTSGGGARKGGVLFEFDPSNNVYKKLIDLDGRPKGSLTVVAGKLYGMTNIGGANGVGVIFEWNLSTGVYSTKVDLNCSYGCDPRGRLSYAEGKFYGVTVSGGVNGVGAIFEWDPIANVITKKFDLSTTAGSNAHGSLTYQEGSLYGMTFYGGANNVGVIFQYDLSTNVYTKRFDFGNGKGGRPKGTLLSVDGKFYGLTAGGGTERGGTLFEWNPTTNTYMQKVAFSSHLIALNGKEPRGSLAYSEGRFYGMTYWGGTSNAGILFEWNSSTNAFTKKLNFAATVPTGTNSTGSLAYMDGKFYGITQGGINNAGGIFEFDRASHKYSRNIDFLKDDNSGNYFLPEGSLSEHMGKLYGTYKDIEIDYNGEIFEYRPSTNEYTPQIDLSCPSYNGCKSNSPMALVAGKFYGTTESGGANDSGVLFEWDPATNIYLTRYHFTNGNGANPSGSLSYHQGKFYGMTSRGGTNNFGVIFTWDPETNIFTKKVDLNNADGSIPYGSLTYNNGKFYGLTHSGGVNDAGVIFEWDPATNVYTKKIDLTTINGSAPKGSLTYSAGRFFGMTSSGGVNNLGVLFEWNPATNVYVKKIDFSAATGGAPVYTKLLEVSTEGVAAPTIPATNIAFSNVLSTSMTVSFQPGNGTKHLAILKAGGAPAFKPVDNTSYSGSLGNGELVVFNGTANTFDVNDLQANKRYYVTVFEYNADNQGNIKYLVENAPVASQQTLLLPNVYLLNPGDGTVNQNVILTLKAKLVEGATTYTFEVSKNSDFAGSRILSGEFSHLIDSLQYNTRYYARVKTNLRDDYGKVTSFTTRTAESLAFVTSPANNAVNVPTKTAVASNSVPYASQYTIQLSETVDFSLVAFQLTGPTRILQFSGLKPNTKYYSRVLVNLSSVFGPVRSFTTQTTTSANMIASAVETDLTEFTIEVYPNPFQERLNLYIESAKSEEAEITLVDVTGRRIHQSTAQTNAPVEIVKPLPDGVYFLKVNAGGNIKMIRVLRAQ
jgi:uncharacterized repeat protein (TIGR03803 family)